ncbi:MAG: YbfB/YjiJ family MFS transporter [Caldimonas sp.]
MSRATPAIVVAAALALGSAVSLGLARFSYALLLPAMRDDLGWSYFTAGAMNTVNAGGYLAGALVFARLLDRIGPRVLFIGGIVATAALMALHGVVDATAALYLLRFATGIGSAATFVSGGLLAARLAVHPGGADAPREGGPSPGLLLGIYYGGTGAGIVASALLVPPLAARPVAHAWQGAWIGLAALALLAAAIAAPATRSIRALPQARGPGGRADLGGLKAGLFSYLLFGFGYIGYMTFVVSLLREQGLAAGAIVAFYALLGIAVIASSWVWAHLLQRHRGGGPMALLNALLALATLLPVVSPHPLAVFASGLLFGGVFLSLVASTTALVRHNLAPAAWGSGIGTFTVVFAFGQIVGPSLVGWVADATGGLSAGLACSAFVLLLAAGVATRQKPLAHPGPERP